MSVSLRNPNRAIREEVVRSCNHRVRASCLLFVPSLLGRKRKLRHPITIPKTKQGMQVRDPSTVPGPADQRPCKDNPVSTSEDRDSATENCNAVTTTTPDLALREGEPRGPVLNPFDCCHPATDEPCFGMDSSVEGKDLTKLAAMYKDVD